MDFYLLYRRDTRFGKGFSPADRLQNPWIFVYVQKMSWSSTRANRYWLASG
jgi:hypothetical protein